MVVFKFSNLQMTNMEFINIQLLIVFLSFGEYNNSIDLIHDVRTLNVISL